MRVFLPNAVSFLFLGLFVCACSRVRACHAENGWCVDGEAHPELTFPGVRTSPELDTEDMKNATKKCCACGGGKGLCGDAK